MSLMEAVATETTTEAPTESTTETTETGSTEQPSTEQASWFWGDDTPGTGDKPEYFMGDKYKTVAEQAKGYKELLTRYNDKLKGFTGNPEQYEMPEVEGLSADHPMVNKLFEIGEKYGMNQDMFNDLITEYNAWGNSELEAMMDSNKTKIEEEIGKLGENAAQRLQNLGDWAKANIKGDGAYEAFESMIKSAEQAQVLEQLIGMTKGQPLADPSKTAPVNNIAQVQKELDEMQFAKDANGRRRIEVDMDYRKEWEKKMKAVYGE